MYTETYVGVPALYVTLSVPHWTLTTSIVNLESGLYVTVGVPALYVTQSGCATLDIYN